MSMGETNESPEVRDDLTGFQTISRGEEIEAKTRDAAREQKDQKRIIDPKHGTWNRILKRNQRKLWSQRSENCFHPSRCQLME